MTPHLLILGSQGQLARALCERAPHAGFAVTCAGRAVADLGRRGAVHALIETMSPDIVVNAAAYTDVDGAERDPDGAFAVNAAGAGEAADAARHVGARFIHVSTDYVFAANGPHLETASPDPVNTYGRSKLAGEHAVAAADPGAAIVRASGIFSGLGRDFPSAMWRLAQGPAPIRVVADQRVTPIYAGDLADRLLQLAARPDASGVFHAVTPGASWFEVAAEALRVMAEAGGAPRTPEPVSSAEFPRPAARPADSRLAGDRLDAATGQGPADWRAGLIKAFDVWRTRASRRLGQSS